MKGFGLLIVLYIFLLPATAGAVTVLADFIDAAQTVVAKAIPLVISLGLLVFLWGLVVFISKAGNENAKEEGRRLMVYGIITLFVMVSVWGIVGLLNQITGITAGGGVGFPQL